MPIYEAPGKDIVRTGTPIPDEPKVFICTIEDTDKGDPCRWCGKPISQGHGKVRS